MKASGWPEVQLNSQPVHLITKEAKNRTEVQPIAQPSKSEMQSHWPSMEATRRAETQVTSQTSKSEVQQQLTTHGYEA